MPLLQVWPTAQRTLQPPQLKGSLPTATQRPLQN
jgi:hypothetical protein